MGPGSVSNAQSGRSLACTQNIHQQPTIPSSHGFLAPLTVAGCWINRHNGNASLLQSEDICVRIVAESNPSNDKAPSHRIFVGRAEIGAAWSKRSEEGRDYLSLKLDDPSFTAPIYANLFDDEGGEGYTLLWSRPRKNGE